MLKSAGGFIFNKQKKPISDGNHIPFKDLTPIDSADKDGTYNSALTFAFKNPRIGNVAVSGPYGSGKSSIIKTFEKKSGRKFLYISLALLTEKNESNNKTLNIERSILQQMLYGADSQKLPHSRFKRIEKPRYAFVKSAFLLVWATSIYYLFQHQNEMFSPNFYTQNSYINALTLLFATWASTLLLAEVYKWFFRVPFKKISLANATIETNDNDDRSVFDRHLDEIVYFFQQTNYDAIIFEDLDRFDKPEVFLKLREINKLINDNEKTPGQTKFLYALRDDMFIHANRTKFFDFIIPIVPIINTTNSLDKMQERLREHKFAGKIDQRFLREVSLYLDDMRLIHNIFNEFEVYYNRLKSDGLNTTKLLAVIIFKNVYPHDFENLHYNRGAFFSICKKKTEILRKCTDTINTQIFSLNASLEKAKSELALNLTELIDTYVGHIAKLNQKEQVVGIVLGGQHVSFSDISTFEIFEPLLSTADVALARHLQPQPHHKLATGKSFEEIEQEINPNESFLDRKLHIENRSYERQIEIPKEIQKCDRELAELTRLQLHELIQRSEVNLDDVTQEFGIEHPELLLYLVKNGYLDDTYHLYTSNFHEGRLTKDDREYLLTIRNFSTPDPNQLVDTPEEVCANMRVEDFGQKYVLNITLFDHLLKNSKTNSNRLKSAMRYLANNFDQSEQFLAAYFNNGKHLDEFTRKLSLEWPQFASKAILSENGSKWIIPILNFVNSDYIVNEMNLDDSIRNYLSEFGHIALYLDDREALQDYNILAKLKVRFHDLTQLDVTTSLFAFSLDKHLYAISHKNINYILNHKWETTGGGLAAFNKANYSWIMASNDKNLTDYIDRNLPEYIENVFFKLPDNSDENEIAIVKLINHPLVEKNVRQQIITSQNYVFKSFDELPRNLWTHTLHEEKITISWENIFAYANEDMDDGTAMTELLEREHIANALSQLEISKATLKEEDRESLSKSLFDYDELDDSIYCRLLRSIPYRYDSFPEEVSENKIQCLLDKNIISLTENSFEKINDDNNLVANLLGNNIFSYIDAKDEYPVEDEVRELLLSTEIKLKYKTAIILDLSPGNVENNSQLSRLIAVTLNSGSVDCTLIDERILTAAILHAPTLSNSIQLLMKSYRNWSSQTTLEIISELPYPYRDISKKGKYPRIPYNEINLEFAEMLKSSDIISSWARVGSKIRINTFRK